MMKFGQEIHSTIVVSDFWRPIIGDNVHHSGNFNFNNYDIRED